MLRICCFAALCLYLSSCSISYKFNGANINYQTTHSISIADFPNNAPMVNPSLSNNLTEGIRDLYQRQTRLEGQSLWGTFLFSLEANLDFG